MMNAMLDRLVLFVLCGAFFAINGGGEYAVVPVLLSMILASLAGIVNRKPLKWACVAVYALLCIAFPNFLLFLPAVAYEIFVPPLRGQTVLAVPVITAFARGQPRQALFSALLLVLSAVMRYRMVTLEKIRADYISLRDSAKEASMKLTEKNRGLMEKQDYEIRVATLNERNRIARDIHDGVGHLLSSSILQVGALTATCGDERIKAKLQTVRATLSQAIDAIRASSHELYDDSIDLDTEIQKMVHNFSFCPVKLEVHIVNDPGRKFKYAVLAIVGEALSNVARHSDASLIRIRLWEHPALYQLVIRDNGSQKDGADEAGIGLANIADRVDDLGGILTINRKNGFQLFITVPREDTKI